MDTLKQKLNRANGTAKLTYYVTADVLKTIYLALFDSHMRYARQILGQIQNKTSDMIKRAKNKAFQQFMELNLYITN